MAIKQVRTKRNKYNNVKYDSDGNILTPARKKELKGLPKKNINGPKWVKLVSQYSSTCFVCNRKIPVGMQILWNNKNKKTRHLQCAQVLK